MTPLPVGWATASLADLLASAHVFTDGDWVETKDQDPDGVVRLTQLADIGVGQWRNRSSRFMRLDRARQMGCTLLEPGDILVARMPEPIGRACLFPGEQRPTVTAVDVCIIRPDASAVHPPWLMWVLNSSAARAQMMALQSGTTRKRISRRNLGTVVVNIPPRAEQERIVATIEEHFSRLDAGETNFRSVGRRIRRLRGAVLRRAVTGRWPVRKLTDVAEVRLGRQRSPKKRLSSGPGDGTSEPLLQCRRRVRTCRLAPRPVWPKTADDTDDGSGSDLRSPHVTTSPPSVVESKAHTAGQGTRDA